MNDNFGKWRSDFKKLVARCTADDAKGKDFVKLLVPDDDDYFVLKPKHSGFYSTTLDLLLTHLNAKNLILTGIAGNNCVLFTANDAYMRDFKAGGAARSPGVGGGVRQSPRSSTYGERVQGGYARVGRHRLRPAAEAA